jgi:NRAMP (natural resistance-associated macrophage protein)-like metal ion transporter
VTSAPVGPQDLATPVSGREPEERPQLVQKWLRSHRIREGVRINVRGRSIRVRGIRAPQTGLLALLGILGPGLIAATAGDDAGGVATYSQVGAQYGYGLMWVLLVVTLSLAIIQETCARLGAATGRGLLDLVRERFGIGWTLLAIIVVLLANGGVIVTEFAGIAAAAELFGLHRLVAVPLTAALLWYFVIRGSHSRVEKVFLLMTLTFLAYPLAAVLARPAWGDVAHGLFVPSIRPDAAYFSLMLALIGTTITPYMQLFQQSAVVEKGVPRRHYGPERTDAYVGAVVSNLIAAFIVIAAGATLNVAGITDINTAQDAARALEPAAGRAAQVLFGVGLLGASLLAAGVLPLATAYSVSEAFGFPKGVDLSVRRAPIFVRVFSVLIVAGAAMALLPGLPLIRLLVGVQVLNGCLLPVLLVFILLLINDSRLAGDLRNGVVNNVLGWATVGLVSSAVLLLFVTNIFS